MNVLQRAVSASISLGMLLASGQPALPRPELTTILARSVLPQPGPDRPTAAAAIGGPSMLFNGATYVSVPNASFPAIGDGSFYLEAWIYPSNTTGFKAIFGKNYLGGLWFGLYNGKLRLYRGSLSNVEHGITIPLNTWTHVAVESYLESYPGSDQYMTCLLYTSDAADE